VSHHDIINDLAICIMVAWVLAVGSQLLKQPLILAYLVAGFAVGPFGVGWIKDGESIQSIAGLGLILLLFMIGLEIDLHKILSAGRSITVTAVSQIVGGCLVGLVFFWGLGFSLQGGKLDALYLAVAATLSSTVISVKILYDKRELDTLAGRITLGVLVLQDLFAILFLALQPNLKSPSLVVLVAALGKAALLVAAAFAISRYALPALFKSVARLPELVLVGALAWCFLVSSGAHALGLSREMGALIAGVALSTFPYALDITAKVTTLRDFFVTLFFVALGMAIPSPTLPVLKWALVISAFVMLSSVLTVFFPLYWMRQGYRVSVLPALNLAQMSEFSLVILALGLKSGQMSKDTFDAAAYGFALLAIFSSYTMVRSDGVLRTLVPWLNRLGLKDLGNTDAFRRLHKKPKIFLLGFSWTASSLLEEMTRTAPELLEQLAVIDYNPVVRERLTKRGVVVIYGDISQRDTLLHAGVGEAETIICTIPNSVLKGATNLKLLQQLKEINPKACVIVHAELIADIPKLYEAGASYITVPRLVEACELCEVVQAAQHKILDAKRQDLDRKLFKRDEVIP
jgi:Kef-type K+ transport system membrane component KefB